MQINVAIGLFIRRALRKQKIIIMMVFFRNLSDSTPSSFNVFEVDSFVCFDSNVFDQLFLWFWVAFHNCIDYVCADSLALSVFLQVFLKWLFDFCAFLWVDLYKVGCEILIEILNFKKRLPNSCWFLRHQFVAAKLRYSFSLCLVFQWLLPNLDDGCPSVIYL